MNLNNLLKRIDRVIVWILLSLFLIFMISGYMITKGFINRYYGLLLHTELDIPIMIFFTAHFLINLRFLLTRWGVKDNLLFKVLVLIIGAIMILSIIYLDQFFSL